MLALGQNLKEKCQKTASKQSKNSPMQTKTILVTHGSREMLGKNRGSIVLKEINQTPKRLFLWSDNSAGFGGLCKRCTIKKTL